MQTPGHIAPGYRPGASPRGGLPQLPERRDNLMAELPVDLEDIKRWSKRTKVKRAGESVILLFHQSAQPAQPSPIRIEEHEH